MPLFSIKGDRLERVKEVSFKSERKDIQHTTESSLKEVFGFEFVKSELVLGSLRIDTLAFDAENKSFVIIEYKIDQSFSVIDQGYAYLALLMNNKAEFILEFNECKNQSLKRDDVDWSQSKVIFVSPQFTKYQKQAINFRDLPIELWEVSKFENGTLLFNQLKSPETSERARYKRSNHPYIKYYFPLTPRLLIFSEPLIGNEVRLFKTEVKDEKMISNTNYRLIFRNAFRFVVSSENFPDKSRIESELEKTSYKN